MVARAARAAPLLCRPARPGPLPVRRWRPLPLRHLLCNRPLPGPLPCQLAGQQVRNCVRHATACVQGRGRAAVVPSAGDRHGCIKPRQLKTELVPRRVRDAELPVCGGCGGSVRRHPAPRRDRRGAPSCLQVSLFGPVAAGPSLVKASPTQARQRSRGASCSWFVLLYLTRPWTGGRHLGTATPAQRLVLCLPGPADGGVLGFRQLSSAVAGHAVRASKLVGLLI